MHIAAIGWIYVVLMMAITEESVIAGIMTFFLYGVLPVTIILYVGGTGRRRQRREQERLEQQEQHERQVMQERQQVDRKDTSGSGGVN